MHYYLTKIKYTKEFADGTLKRITEPYLIGAVSFTDAETRIHKEVGEFVRGEFMVTAISLYTVTDIFFYDDAETWYRGKVSYVTEDADSGKEKKVNNYFLVTAQSPQQAIERITTELKSLMATFEHVKIEKTNIVELFPYESSN